MNTADNLITRQQAAGILGCHIQTVNNYLRDGLLTRYRHQNGYHVFVDRKEVEQLLRPRPA